MGFVHIFLMCSLFILPEKKGARKVIFNWFDKVGDHTSRARDGCIHAVYCQSLKIIALSLRSVNS